MGDSSVMRMDRKNFNYKKELKQLFTKSAQAYGALGLDEEEKEERKNRGAGEMGEQYEGASKKMKRRIKMIERMQDKLKVGSGRKYLMVQPDPNWPKVDKILTMEQVRVDKKTGQKVF
jgi:ATPase subunit of ABC transporter with duplicated ATPase domains